MHTDIISQLQTWSVVDLEQTTDHLGEIFIEVLENANYKIPEGLFNSNMHYSILQLRKDYDTKNYTNDEIVSRVISVMLNSENYK